MADFGINATELSAPQGAGTSPVAPVEERTVNTFPTALAEGIVDIFAKGLKQNAKQEAEKRKNAIVGEFVRQKSLIADGVANGQLKPHEAGARSRALTMQFFAGYSEYIKDFEDADKAMRGLTDLGQAEKEEEAHRRRDEKDMEAASSLGYIFDKSFSPETNQKILESYRASRRFEEMFRIERTRAEETRNQESHEMSKQKHQMFIRDDILKERSTQGVLEIIDRNYDALHSAGWDLINDTKMPYEQKMMIHTGNIRRIKTELNAIAARNPEVAAPWVKLLDEMDITVTKLLDPNVKDANELERLKNLYQTQIVTQQLAVIADPDMRKAVVDSMLFKDTGLLTLYQSPALKNHLEGNLDSKSVIALANAGAGADVKIVGTKNEAVMLDYFRSSMKALQNGKLDGVGKEKATIEAVNVGNLILKQTAEAGKSNDPKVLKQLSSLYASSEFGKLAKEGKLDRDTLMNAQKVFQMRYDEVVVQAVMNKLSQPLPNGERDSTKGMNTVQDELDIRFQGSGVVFEHKKKGETAAERMRQWDRKKDLDRAAEGLNTLIQLHAHLEGTTDYKKYWEDNKHRLMPNVFPDPNKLKPGTVVDGYKYIGGAYSDRNNWQKVN